MTREEVRQEAKETDGSPEVKGRIRRVQQEIARRRMMHEVPKADVVVTNPTHYAVALRYDDKRARAPVVVAKGADLVAAKIRALPASTASPIFAAPPLARVLFRNVDIGGEIPPGSMRAVAQVLTYVYQLRRPARRATPPEPPIDPAGRVTGSQGDPHHGRRHHRSLNAAVARRWRSAARRAGPAAGHAGHDRAAAAAAGAGRALHVQHRAVAGDRHRGVLDVASRSTSRCSRRCC